MTLKEGAVGFAVLGSLAAVAIPVFLRELHASRLVEAIDGTARLGTAAVAHAAQRRVVDAFPPSAPLTPAAVPRAKLELDPAGTWDGPTWKALAFRPAPEDAPHAFAFAFDRQASDARSSFVARAHGDLDGDGRTSTFEIRGHASATEPPRLEPGSYVEAELE